jgi:hypothetical protein
MEIVNGRWQHQGKKIDKSNFAHFKRLRNVLILLYGYRLDCDKITMISSILNTNNSINPKNLLEEYGIR